MPKKADNSQANTERSRSNADKDTRHAVGNDRHAVRRRSIVKTCPIVKNNKWYMVGDKFPYNPTTDKKLLWNLVDISENKTKGK